MPSYNLAIVGAGPGGYVAAIRAAQLGASVALVEKGELGGVCLNRGCIPTKALIVCAHALEVARRAPEFGVALPAGPVAIDMAEAHARKEGIVKKLRGGISQLLRSHGVEIIAGEAAFAGGGKIAVAGEALDAARVLIATGSAWIDLPALKRDGRLIVTSDEALEWQDVPPRLAIVGGGVVGCEFACMMRVFGSEVTVVEATPSILPTVERAISRILSRSMKGRGIEILLSTTVQQAQAEGDEVVFTLSTNEERRADRMIVAAGRRPFTRELRLEAAGIAVTEQGFIRVDENFQTSAEAIFAIGDVIGPPMLAHAASAEGIALAELIFSAHDPRSTIHDPRSTIARHCPSPIFTSPEIASVGLTSEELEQKGVPFRTGRFPYAASGKALCDGEPEGQAIVHAGAEGKILGVHLFGEGAATLIAEGVLAISQGMTVRDVAAAVHTHPTLSEIFAEACEDAVGRAIHKGRLETRDSRRETGNHPSPRLSPLKRREN